MYREINDSEFTNDLQNILSPEIKQVSVEQQVGIYNSMIESVIDKHAPIRSKKITIRPNTEWYTDVRRNSKRERRKAERKMRKTKLTIHQQLYKQKCIQTNKQLLKCRKDYYSSKIAEISCDQKQLYRITSHLMRNKRDVVLPPHHNEKDLSNRFCKFFLGKIDTILGGLCDSISEMSRNRDFLSADNKFEGEHLRVLSPRNTTRSQKKYFEINI